MFKAFRTGTATAIFATILLTGSSVAVAQHSQPSTQGHAGTHEFHRHHIALFLGATNGVLESGHGEDHGHGTESKKRNTDFSIGVDYQYRVHRYLGLGALMDYAAGDLRTTVFAAGAFIRPVGGLQILTAPGFESHAGKRHALFRLGFYYEFPFADRFALTPNFNIDFVNGEQVYIYGVAFGVGF